MATKKSVFLSDYTVGWIESTTKKDSHDQGPKWSESLNATVEQFRHLLRTNLPELTRDEWTCLLNVYTGCYFPAHGVPARIASDMMDNVGAVDIAELSDEYAELVRKTHAMSQAQQLAILYFVQMFWASDWKGDWDEIEKTIKEKF
jgi:hypothetical protein